MATVLVTDARLGSAVSVIRSLGRRGHTVVAADSEPRNPGFSSRYVTSSFCYPNDPYEAVDTITAEARRRSVDLVVPVTDDVIVPLMAARAEVERWCRVALPSAEAWATARDKDATAALATALGIDVPRAALAETPDDVAAHAGALGWPVVLKPTRSRASLADGTLAAMRVAYANDVETAVSLARPMLAACPLVVQEYTAGTAVGVELLCHEGRPLAAFQHRRIHEVPLTGGASSLRESMPLDPDLFDMAASLLGALGWTGLAMVEFKVGPSRTVLMEINGRIWGSLPLAVRAGMDFPARMAELYLDGQRPSGPVVTTYRTPVRCRNLDLEMLWIGSVLRGRSRYPFLPGPPRRAAVVAAARLLDVRIGNDMFASGDLRPGLTELGAIARKVWHKVADGPGP